MNDRFSRLAARVAALDAAGLRRQLRRVEPLSAATARVNGREMLQFCSNDYLGLAEHPEVRAAFSRGGGAGSARLVSGNRPAHDALEAALSEHFGRPATLFPSGFQANLGLLTTVLEAGDLAASDALNHASIIDGLRLSKAERVVLEHGKPERVPVGARLAVTESLFSMDGDVADLAAWTGGHWLAVDEAHAVGTLGPHGRGAAAAQGIEPDFLVGTLGKAYGSAGAFVIGPPALRELLVSTARAFVYTTGMPEPVAHAALAGLRLATDERRERLAANALRLRTGLLDLGLPVLGSAHIVPVLTGDTTMAVAARLAESGIFAPGIRYPTVARGQERVRLTVCSEHTTEQIDRCVEAMGRAVRFAAINA
ncbi:8-amino-7-oxononanoate synthase [Deltaproteobacteria bacterium]|nr:8-amino-7-oxononanoate synthase [Deltaproteobacteria bacterium]